MLTFTNVLYLFTHELAGLCRWGFAGAFVLASPLECGLVWHEDGHANFTPRYCRRGSMGLSRTESSH
jgi:hypothetical protein